LTESNIELILLDAIKEGENDRTRQTVKGRLVMKALVIAKLVLAFVLFAAWSDSALVSSPTTPIRRLLHR
jgi:hypothetical protein